MYTYWKTDTVTVPHNDTKDYVISVLKHLRYIDGAEIKIEALRDENDLPNGECLITIKHLEDGVTY